LPYFAPAGIDSLMNLLKNELSISEYRQSMRQLKIGGYEVTVIPECSPGGKIKESTEELI
jgi:hypothetical protein